MIWDPTYRDQVERLERGCVGTIRKEHFTSLYSPARKIAITDRKIRPGWAKAGLFPFNPDKVLSDIPKPTIALTAPFGNVANIGCSTEGQATTPQTPVTPMSAGAVTSLHNLIKEDAHTLDESQKQPFQKRVQKLANAAQVCFAEHALLPNRIDSWRQ